MGLIEWLKLGLKIKAAQKDTDRRIRMGEFSWKTNLWKGAVSFLKTSAGIVIPGLLAYWSDPEAVKQFLEGIDMAKWAPVVTAIITMFFNWNKNRAK